MSKRILCAADSHAGMIWYSRLWSLVVRVANCLGLMNARSGRLGSASEAASKFNVSMKNFAC